MSNEDREKERSWRVKMLMQSPTRVSVFVASFNLPLSAEFGISFKADGAGREQCNYKKEGNDGAGPFAASGGDDGGLGTGL